MVQALLQHPAYEYGEGDSLIEPLIPFVREGYIWFGAVVPRVLAQNVAARGQVEDKVSVPGGSYLLGFSAFSTQAAGFRFRIHDVGRDRYALTERWDNNRSGAQDTTDADPNLHILPDPYLIVAPGILEVAIVNLATVANPLSLLLHIAIPLEVVK